MNHQLLPLARQLSATSHDTSNTQRIAGVDSCTDKSRICFTRSALFTALASSLVGFGIAPAVAADTTIDVNTSSQVLNGEVTVDRRLDSAIPPQSVATVDDDAQLDIALDALRLRKAVQQGTIDRSVLDDYTEQNLRVQRTDDANNDLLQQAITVQQQGYQMMTPEQIDDELNKLNDQNDDDYTGNSTNGFDAPIATLDSRTAPIGLDVDLDATSLPTPTNLDTLGLSTAAERAETAEIMARPIAVSDAVSSGRVDAGADLTEQDQPVQTLAQQERNPTIGTDRPRTSSEIVASINDDPAILDADDTPSVIINPDDYLPDYQAETQAVTKSIEQASKPKPLARNNGGIVKRLYNRLFNGGVMALPNIETTVYLQQAAADNAPNAQPTLIEADDKIQPINNIKAALDDTNVQSIVDFTAALPRLRQTALDAARAVGYYDVTLRLRQPTADTIEVIIEKLGEPVRVDSRIVDIRGEGIKQQEFQVLEKSLPPQEGDIFNHRVYKNSKAALESLSNTYGYFDKYWLNKSVDIILPDNTADVSLVYNTGDRYEFDDVVFFTYDEASGTLTRDPEKLPVELSLLRQLFDFKSGDPFYRPAITKFSNDLSATRYFNTVNVESILPPDERSESSTLAFNNIPSNADNDDIVDDDVNEVDDNVTTASNAGASTSNGKLSASNSGATVAEEDVAPIEFEVDQETQDKLLAIKQKANRLSRLPNDRVLDEKDQKTDSLLGKISDSISSVAEKIFPEEESLLADENFIPPTLAGRITPQQVQESKKIPLYVFVSANKPRDAQVGIGYGTDTGVRATAKIDYNLLNRKGYQAGAETEVSRINKNITVYASRPWKHPLNDTLNARLTYEEEVIDQGEGNFDLSTKTLKAALARNIRRESGWNRSYSVRYRLDELETGVDDTNLDDLPIRFTSSNPKQQALLFGYGMSKTDVDSVTNPTSGLRQYYGIEVGADKALSDTDLAIVRAGVSGIYSFGDANKHQVLGGVNAGYIWADDFYDVPYKLRFFAGGDQSIRGYDYESLSPIDKGYLTGGQILAVGSAEYNYEFRPGFRGAIFTDVGNAYDKDFDTETKVGVGVGIRWASPVGVVRVDVAAGVTEESIPIRLHFFIGSPL